MASVCAERAGWRPACLRRRAFRSLSNHFRRHLSSTASKEWAQLSGDPEAWRRWWEDPEAESYYFVGKDNIPFHTVIWPGMLLGYGGLNLPTDVPANQYVTFGSEKASASRGVGRSIGWYAERLATRCVALRHRLGPPGAERHRSQRRGDHPPDQRRAGGHLGQPGQSGPLPDRRQLRWQGAQSGRADRRGPGAVWQASTRR